MTRLSRRLVRVTATAIVLVPSIVSAAVDMTGAWWVHATNFGNLSVVENWTQTGTSVSTGTFTGIINPNTGVFSLTGPSAPPPICPPDTLNGTASLDNETWTGTEVEHFPGSPTLCLAGTSLTLAAQRIPANCGDGVVDPDEQCDDGNLTEGDGCNPLCQIETCYACSGAPSQCAFAPAGSFCDDGNPCTADACDGSGHCDATGPTECASNCTVHSCLSAKMNKVAVTIAGAQKKLTWKWTKGAPTTDGDFGLPTGTTVYTLCLFAGTANARIGGADIPASSQKWQSTARGFTYEDATGTPGGISKAVLISGAVNKSKILVKGKGANLDLDMPAYDLPLLVQLSNSSSDVCWSATFDGPDVIRNQSGAFKAKFKTP